MLHVTVRGHGYGLHSLWLIGTERDRSYVGPRNRRPCRPTDTRSPLFYVRRTVVPYHGDVDVVGVGPDDPRSRSRQDTPRRCADRSKSREGSVALAPVVIDGAVEADTGNLDERRARIGPRARRRPAKTYAIQGGPPHERTRNELICLHAFRGI